MGLDFRIRRTPGETIDRLRAAAEAEDELDRLRGVRVIMESLEAASEEAPDDELDMGDTWHAVFYLLTGEDAGGDDEPLAFLMGGYGDLAGDQRCLSAQRVELVASALEAATGADLRSRFDPGTMEMIGIYRSWRHPGALDELIESFERLRSFVGETARKRMGLLVMES